MTDCKTDDLKNALDEWLNTIIYEPIILGYAVNWRLESHYNK